MARKKGSKLSRTEIFNVRFDPILKMAAELAAGQDRRTLSSFVEVSVEKAVKETQVTSDGDGNPVTAWQVAQACWSPEPAIRINNLANRYPDVLTTRERKIVQGKKLLSGSAYQFDENKNLVETILTEEGWKDLCRYADDEITFDELQSALRRIHAAKSQSS